MRNSILFIIILLLIFPKDLRSEKDNFKYEMVVTGLEIPWSFTFLPDNSILINEKRGELIHFKNGKKINLPLVYEVELLDGEKIVSITQPGGGYGFPYDREIERVKKDFVEGWISNSRAFNVYGVKLSNNGKVDYIKTEVKRKLLKKANKI